mmetsp:Transcript_221/g.492  ORF Transcript_221/g.492 Transcript_221/m.492 type:complete len:119 (+) Transcript_221:113-469(+)
MHCRRVKKFLRTSNCTKEHASPNMWEGDSQTALLQRRNNRIAFCFCSIQDRPWNGVLRRREMQRHHCRAGNNMRKVISRQANKFSSFARSVTQGKNCYSTWTQVSNRRKKKMSDYAVK